MRAKVFCVLKKFAQELRDKEGVRQLRNGGMEVECRLNEVRKDGLRAIYAIEPRYPVTGKHYFELQLAERGEKNIGEIVTNFSGKKLIPRWRGKNTVGFRTSKGQLLSIIGYAVRGMAEIIVHTFQVEGRTVYLTEEGFGPYKARYDYEDETWAISLPKELEQMAEAVAVAMEKAECNCFKKGCQYHYAFSEEEAKKVLAERREKQKAAAEAAKTDGKTLEEPIGEETTPEFGSVSLTGGEIGPREEALIDAPMTEVPPAETPVETPVVEAPVVESVETPDRHRDLFDVGFDRSVEAPATEPVPAEKAGKTKTKKSPKKAKKAE